MTTFLPPVSIEVMAQQAYADKVKEKTNGRVTIKIFPAGTLISQMDTPSGVKAGTADMGFATIDSFPDQYPINGIMVLPFLPLGDWKSCASLWTKFQAQFPDVKNEWEKDFKVLYRVTRYGMQLHTQKVVKTPADIKGVKMFGTQDWAVLGASPMFLAVPEWQSSVQRGLINAMCLNWDAIHDTGAYENLKYHTIFPSYTKQSLSQIIMNKNTWNKLPSDIQKVFDDLSTWIPDVTGQMVEEKNKKDMDDMISKGHTMTTLTPAEEKVWLDAITPAHTEYLKKIEAKGIKATDMYNALIKLAASK
jgi:TRAP-type C4-dicarboxylate transport system substrate-binding protein